MNCPPLSAVCSTIRSCAGLAEHRLPENAKGPEMMEWWIAMSRFSGTESSALLLCDGGGGPAFLPGTRIRGTGGRMSEGSLEAVVSPALNCAGAGMPLPPWGGSSGNGVPRPFVGTDGGASCCCFW